ncbi:sorting nexin-1 [Striga asiatica]|uniref:Sorting nexin-1 n=1 Tax=Striga asiatica TaxID=4170 RepID=A0A5A7RF37_STRAF|nr:sorting nexin-1 [Striga asiatica]
MFLLWKVGHIEKACSTRVEDIANRNLQEGQFGDWIRVLETYQGINRQNSESPSNPSDNQTGYEGAAKVSKSPPMLNSEIPNNTSTKHSGKSEELHKEPGKQDKDTLDQEMATAQNNSERLTELQKETEMIDTTTLHQVPVTTLYTTTHDITDMVLVNPQPKEIKESNPLLMNTQNQMQQAPTPSRKTWKRVIKSEDSCSRKPNNSTSVGASITKRIREERDNTQAAAYILSQASRAEP